LDEALADWTALAKFAASAQGHR